MYRFIMILLAMTVTMPVLLKGRTVGRKSTPAALSVPGQGRGYIRVGGDVDHPGIYFLDDKTMTLDVIYLAQPVSPLKRLVPDGIASAHPPGGSEMLLSGSPDGRGEITIRSMSSADRLLMGIPLDINAMTAADFERLPGIGPVLAQRIVVCRQKNGGNMSVRDLMSVEGIGEKSWLRLKTYFQPPDITR